MKKYIEDPGVFGGTGWPFRKLPAPTWIEQLPNDHHQTTSNTDLGVSWQISIAKPPLLRPEPPQSAQTLTVCKRLN